MLLQVLSSLGLAISYAPPSATPFPGASSSGVASSTMQSQSAKVSVAGVPDEVSATIMSPAASSVGPGTGPGGSHPNLLSSSSVVAIPVMTTSTLSSAVPTSTTDSGSLAQASVSSDKKPTDACWATAYCIKAMSDFRECYTNVGSKLDSSANVPYQTCLCTQKHYQSIMDQRIQRSSMDILDCFSCMQAAGVNITLPNLPTMQLKWKIYDFCNTAQPNLVDLLMKLRDWVGATSITPLYDTTIGNITAALPSQFTSTAGMDAPTTIPNTLTHPTPNATPTDGLAWWQSTLTSNALIPTEYLAQVPSNWPYTEYGIMRKAGKTTFWPFVNPNATTSTVAWLYASVLWNLRPLVTPASKKMGNAGAGDGKEIWQPELEGWTPGFIYEIETVPVTEKGSGTAGSGSPKSSSRLVSTSATSTSTVAAAALGYDIPISVPGSTTSSTLPPLSILQPPSSTPSSPSPIIVPPSQDPKLYTPTSIPSLSSTSSSGAFEPTCLRCPDAGGGMGVQITSSADAQVTGIEEPEQTELSHLWDVVQSMRSRLAG